jgi:hypothetical protein
MLGLLKKDTKKIQQNIQEMAATYLPKSYPLKIDVRTPQSALLANGTPPDAQGTLPLFMVDRRYENSCDKPGR